ncbi:ELWxxDGT repeat protein [Herpetosiphon llansteffanensis]|uniref:ELWxxDGT repeat protein n=1 Tax=Herpetosiphon llansteffanensis TaxID=2094568 RepID=UPI000D7CCFD9|nr:ELWxxDGT repeat protein [Herpetosiphon llansteffanensis]
MRRSWMRFVALCAIVFVGSNWLVSVSAESSIELLKDIAPGSNSSVGIISTIGSNRHTMLNGISYFIANDGGLKDSLWRSDGTEAGTFKLTTDGQESFLPTRMIAFGDNVYFATSTPQDGFSIWRSDGSANTLVKVVSFNQGILEKASHISLLPVINNTLYFFFSNEGKLELWKLDQALQPILITSLEIYPSTLVKVQVQPLIDFQGSLYFVATSIDDSNITYQIDLWKTDGTATGTSLVHVMDNRRFSEIKGPIVVNGKLLLISSPDGLLVSDGTPNGLQPLIDPNEGGGVKPQIVSLNGQGFISFSDRIWRTDGTLEGTYPLDVNPSGPDAAVILNTLDDYIYFIADHSSYGRELWRSDGTSAGTTLVQDINPGGQGSFPQELTKVGERLYFSAYTPVPTNSNPQLHPWKLDCTGTQASLIGPPEWNTLVNPYIYLANPRGVIFAAYTPDVGLEPRLYRESGNTWLHSNPVVATTNDQVAAIPVTLGNDGTIMHQNIDVTLTLTNGIEYLSDTSGITPTIEANTVTWQFNEIPTNCSEQTFMVYVGLPNSPIGDQKAFTLAINGMDSTDTAGDNQADGHIFVRRTIFLPAIQ